MPTWAKRPPDRPSSARPGPNRLRRKAIVFSLLSGLIVFGGLWGFPHWRALHHWYSARTASEDRDFPAARKHLERCLEFWPDDAGTLFELARVYRREGISEVAAAKLEQARKFGHSRAEIELEESLGRIQSGYVRALEDIPAAMIGPAQDRLVREALVMGHLHSHSLDRAYRVTEKWLTDHPEDWQAYLWHARVLAQGLQFELAADAYAQAFRLRPGQLEVERGFGEVLLRLGHYAEAVPYFEAVLRITPHDAAARVGLARCQRNLHPPSVARATLEPLMDRANASPAVCLLAGELALDEDHPQEAEVWLRQAVAKAPYDRDANQALARALYQLDQVDEAKQFEETAEAINRDYKRMEEITKAVVEQPAAIELRYEAGLILARLGQDDGAARWLMSALAIDPTHQPTRQALAESAARLGDPRLADYARRVLAAPTPRP
jgi:Tfp pilus assembly protein PilF